MTFVFVKTREQEMNDFLYFLSIQFIHYTAQELCNDLIWSYLAKQMEIAVTYKNT